MSPPKCSGRGLPRTVSVPRTQEHKTTATRGRQSGVLLHSSLEPGHQVHVKLCADMRSGSTGWGGEASVRRPQEAGALAAVAESLEVAPPCPRRHPSCPLPPMWLSQIPAAQAKAKPQVKQVSVSHAEAGAPHGPALGLQQVSTPREPSKLCLWWVSPVGLVDRLVCKDVLGALLSGASAPRQGSNPSRLRKKLRFWAPSCFVGTLAGWGSGSYGRKEPPPFWPAWL